jgi:hypothetical protein
MTPTKAGTWTLNASGGIANANYGTGITVVAGSPASGTIVPAANVVYRAGSNVLTASNIADSYGNLCSGTFTMTETYTGTYSGFTSTNLDITVSNGSGTVITPAFNQVYGVITYHFGPLQCSFNVWMNPNYTISAGTNYFSILDASSDVWYTGGIGWGQKSSLSNIVGVAGGLNAAYLEVSYDLDSSGHVWAFGPNNYGQLGDGTLALPPSPVEVVNLSNIVSVASGGDSGYALDSSGHVWAWGNNSNGQLGTNCGSYCDTPIQVPNLNNIISIAAESTGQTAFALDSSGNIWAWGSGPLGNGSISGSTTPVKVNGSNYVSIAAGGSFVVALNSSGNVFAWGNGSNFDIGTYGGYNSYVYSPNQIRTWTGNLSNIVAINAGYDTAYAINSSGQVWAWGDNTGGAFGAGTSPELLFGYNASPYADPVLNSSGSSQISNIVAIAGGQYKTISLDSSGQLWMWGQSIGSLPAPYTEAGLSPALP